MVVLFVQSVLYVAMTAFRMNGAAFLPQSNRMEYCAFFVMQLRCHRCTSALPLPLAIPDTVQRLRSDSVAIAQRLCGDSAVIA
jgi:hypothetical protein